MGAGTEQPHGPAAPFDTDNLDALLAAAGADAVLATSPHNLRYLLGGYSYFMYKLADSIGLSRYMPALAYRRAAVNETLYIGAGNEDWATDVTPLWVPDVRNVSWGANQTAELLIEWARAHLSPSARLLVELPYLPAEAYREFEASGLALADGTALLEELRAVKRPHELEIVRSSSTAVVDSMLATFASTKPGDTRRDIFERLGREESKRGLTFCYALVAAGADLNRAPALAPLKAGDILSLDSGATYQGWVADLTRMGIAGEPTPRHDDLLAQVDHIQQAAIEAARAGTRGADLFDVAGRAIQECEDCDHASFLVHGTGLVTHEAPRLTATGSPPYPATHAEQPLRAGIVLSVESQIADPVIGFVKLEDTVIVHEGDPELVANRGRGWNRLDG